MAFHARPTFSPQGSRTGVDAFTVISCSERAGRCQRWQRGCTYQYSTGIGGIAGARAALKSRSASGALHQIEQVRARRGDDIAPAAPAQGRHFDHRRGDLGHRLRQHGLRRLGFAVLIVAARDARSAFVRGVTKPAHFVAAPVEPSTNAKLPSLTVEGSALCTAS